MSGWHDLLPPEATVNDFSATTFLVQSMLSRIRTMTLVKVVGVTNTGGVSPIGTVDLVPCVNLMDGSRQATSHGTIYKCPYLRIQGGTNAIILDPQVGDIGWAGFADRDIQTALANKGPSNPGSARMFDWADGVYLGMVTGPAPTQYVQFNTDGITIVSPTLVKVQAPDVQVSCSTAEVTTTGNATVSVGGSASVTVAGSATFAVTGNMGATVGGNFSVTATGAINLSGATINATASTGGVFSAPAATAHAGSGTGGFQFTNLITISDRAPQLFA